MAVQIYVRDQNLNRIGGELDDWQSLSVTVPWTGVGSWTLKMPTNHWLTEYLLRPKAGIYIQLDGQYLISGPAFSPRREAGDDHDVLTLTGPSDSVRLAQRRAEPCVPVEGEALKELKLNQLTAELAGLIDQVQLLDDQDAGYVKLTLQLISTTSRIASIETWPEDSDEQIAQKTGALGNANGLKETLEVAIANMDADHEDRQVKRASAIARIAEIPNEQSFWNSITSRITPNGHPVLSRLYAAAAYDSQTGSTEALLKHYVDANLGPGTRESRRLALLQIAPDRARGMTISHRSRFAILMKELQAIALKGGDLGFSIEQQGTLLVFEVKLPRNRSSSMVFTPSYGTLSKFSYDRQPPEANEFLIGDEKEATSRTFLESKSDSSIEEWGLIENEIRDRGGSDELSKLYENMDEDMAKADEKLSIALTTSDTEARQYRRDWDVGDYVKVRVPTDNGEIDFVEMVRSATLSWSSPTEAVKIEALIASPDAEHPLVPDIFRKQRELATRTSRLESR